MAPVTVDHFTDPFSPWCWAAQPTLRRLRYEFEDVEWTPRMTVLLPGGDADWPPDDAEDAEALRDTWAAAAGATGMPVADQLWTDGLPSSRLACSVVAFIRETTPNRAHAVLRRLRVAAFAEGLVFDDPESVTALAADVDGVERAPIERALDDGRAADALETDLRLAVEVAGQLDDAEVRGDVSTRPAGPRLGDDALDEEYDEDGEPAEPVLVGPPTLRVRAAEGSVLADAGLPFGRLASALGRSVPRTGVDASDKYATGRMAMHIGREAAESLSGRDFRDAVRPYIRRFGSAYLPEVVAGTGLSRETCGSTLASLVEAGEVERVGRIEWRTVDDPGDPRGET